jgi:hypothetical protein
MRVAGLLPIAVGLLLEPACLQARTGDPTAPIEEEAADLGYGYCPQYLAGAFALEGNETLDKMGFVATVKKKQHPRFGELSVRSVEKADGGIAFGGAPEAVCTVVVDGDHRASVLERWRHDMPLAGFSFSADASNPSKPAPNITMELYRARLTATETLNVQLIDAAASAAIFQLFVTKE